jgi:hypothetical protein
VHWWTGGLIDPGPGRDELARRALLHRIRRPLPAPHRVAVMSIKGGVGKTTVAACLGLTLAEHRGDRIVVLDANPDAGTLAERLTGEAGVTVRELLRDLDRIHSWSDMSRYTSLAGRCRSSPPSRTRRTCSAVRSTSGSARCWGGTSTSP